MEEYTGISYYLTMADQKKMLNKGTVTKLPLVTSIFKVHAEFELLHTNALLSNISMLILHIVLWLFLVKLTKIIFSAVRSLFCWQLFPLRPVQVAANSKPIQSVQFPLDCNAL